jgi:hypothetical protein
MVAIKQAMSAYVAVYVPSKSFFKQWPPVYTKQGGERAFRQIQSELEQSAVQDDPTVDILVDPANRVSLLRILHHLYRRAEVISKVDAALYISSLKTLCEFPYFLLVGESVDTFRVEQVTVPYSVQQMTARNVAKYPRIKKLS